MPARLFSFGQAIEGVTQGLAEAMPMVSSLATVGTALSASRLSSLAQGLIPKPEAPLSANEIIRQVRAAGFKVRRQAALKVIGQLKQQVTFRAYVQQLGPNALPVNRYLSMSTYARPTRYQYFVQLDGVDANTGETRTQFVTVVSDRRMSKSEAEFNAVFMAEQSQNYDYTEITGSTTVHITRSPSFNWAS